VHIRVSTKLSWQQTVQADLFSPELDRHIEVLGHAERARVGIAREFTVTATATDSDAWITATWRAGSFTPEWSENEVFDPPLSTDEDLDHAAYDPHDPPYHFRDQRSQGGPEGIA
jgi:hypothetical protein